MSAAEETLALHMRAHGFQFVREHRFGAEACGGTGKGLRARLADAGLRDWRFDFAMPGIKLAIEVEGITSYGKTKTGKMALGRHQTAKGIEGDMQKYDAAMRLGWDVYRCSQAMVKSGQAIETIKIIMGLKGEAA